MIRRTGSSEVAECASLALFARRTAVLPRWSARVLRDAFSTLSPRRPAANECSTHRYAMYTDSPAALRCKTDPFQRSRLSDPEAPSSTSVTAEGAQTASVSHLYGTPRALPLRCGPAKLGTIHGTPATALGWPATHLEGAESASRALAVIPAPRWLEGRHGTCSALVVRARTL